jgi:hypothetical protein
MTEAPEAPFVTLGGEKYSIQRPVWKQLRQIRDPIYALSDAITDPQTGRVSEKLYKELSPERYEQMGRVVYVALTRTKPELTAEQFDEIEIGEFELLNAFLVIRLQTGQYIALPAGGGGEGPLAERGQEPGA